jgi:hypothetical protein
MKATMRACALACALLSACAPKREQFMEESLAAFQPYITGDLSSAKAALLAEEQVIARFEAAGTRGYDFHHAYLCVYGRLCAVTLAQGETNAAHRYFLQAMVHRNLKNDTTFRGASMDELLSSIERLDTASRPAWRVHRKGAQQ